MKKSLSSLCMLPLLSLIVMGLETRAQEAAVPPEFDYVGTYLFEKKVKLRGGEVFAVSMKPMKYRLFTDGISIRLYGGDAGGYTSYEVYRSDGLIEAPDRTSIETVAGVQAKSVTGRILRQLTLTKRRMTITTHPAVSEVIEVVYAMRIDDGSHFEPRQR